MANNDTTFKLGFARINNVVAYCLAFSFVIIALVAAIEIERFYRDKYLPNSFINNIEVSNLTQTEALTKLNNHNQPPAIAMKLLANDQVATLSAEQVGATYNNQFALQNLESSNHNLPWYKRYILALGLGDKNEVKTPLLCNEAAITAAITELAIRTHIPNKSPSVVLATSSNKNTIKIDPGKIGFEIDATASAKQIAEQCSEQTTPTALEIALPTVTPPTPLTEDEMVNLRQKAEKLVSKKLALKIQNNTFYLHDQQLIGFFDSLRGWDKKNIELAIQNISKQILSEPVDAVLEYDPNTLKVTKFIAPRDGLSIDTPNTINQITAALDKWQTNEPLADIQQDLIVQVSAQKPNITLDKTNNLGINELIGYGDSAYAHSIPTRVHNVALTASRINLIIIKPNTEFSFNKALGEVSKATGFQPAYVIKSGKTELGDGGGVCQVSSTLFRAAMNAGLNITRRRPHSYRVSYYELNSKPGFDATVYSGEVDFRFINDTPGHLLLFTETDSKNLTMKIEVYGTSDGRVSSISDYKSWDARPAAPTQYIDDPALPPGKLKQVDWSAPGLKTSFVYTVKDKFGTVKQQETYYSNYLPWSAKYLRGPG